MRQPLEFSEHAPAIKRLNEQKEKGGSESERAAIHHQLARVWFCGSYVED